MNREEILETIKSSLKDDTTPIPDEYIVLDLSHGAMMLFLYFYSLRISGDMSYSKIARNLKVGTTTVQRWAKELVDKGLLKVERKNGSWTHTLILPKCDVYDLAKAWYFEEEKCS